MMTFVLSFVIIALAGLGLAIGLLAGNRGLARPCCQKDQPDTASGPCSLCGRDRPAGQDS